MNVLNKCIIASVRRKATYFAQSFAAKYASRPNLGQVPGLLEDTTLSIKGDFLIYGLGCHV